MKKKRIIIISLITIIIGIIGVVGAIFFFHSDKKITFKERIVLNLGKKVPTIYDVVQKNFKKRVKNTEISWKDMNIENDRIYYTGIYLGTFIYEEEEHQIQLLVIDKEPPKIEGVKDIEFDINDKLNFYKDVKITDNSKDELDKKIEGKYDLNTKGEYKLKYVITDKSGNKTEKPFKLTVKTKSISIDDIVVTKGKTTSKGFKIDESNGLYYINGILIVNKTYSLPSTYKPSGLLDSFNTNFNNMSTDAQKEGINLKIVSGFRSYSTQQTLYNNYVARDGQAAADRYSARAGHSEHQTGLAADINLVDQSFENTKEGQWLNNNCYKYGFIIRYPKGKEDSTGYMFEPWHIRYVGVDLATKLYNNGNWITLEEYLGINSKY